MDSHSKNSQLTRYLYRYGDVIASLVEAIITNNVKYTLFWISELFLSGFERETLEHLKQIYYDYYFINYSQLERKLFKNQNTLQSNLLIGKTLTLLKKISTFSLELSLLSKIQTLEPSYVYPKTPKHLTEYNEPKLVQSIEHGHIQNIAYFFRKKEFTRYVADLQTVTKIKKKLTPENYMAHISKHIYMKRYKSLKINQVKMATGFTKSEEEFLEQANSEPQKINPCVILAKYQLVPIATTQLYYYNTNQNLYSADTWLYDAYNTPIWLERFKKHNAIQDHKKKTVIFSSEDCEERFYQLYGYDPDEEPIRSTSNAFKEVSIVGYKKWRERLF